MPNQKELSFEDYVAILRRRRWLIIVPAVLGANSEPLDLGRLRRLISPGLRRALYLRDRGCAFPGCHRPPRHCQGHQCATRRCGIEWG